MDGHAHGDLICDLDEYFRHLAHSDNYEMFPERAREPPEFLTRYERVSPELLPLRTFAVRVTGNNYLFCVRADMMSADICDEMNDDLLPSMQGALRSRARPQTIAEPTVSDILDEFDTDLD